MQMSIGHSLGAGRLVPSSSATLLSSYALPPADIPGLVTQDYGLEDVAAHWDIASGGWDSSVAGTLRKTTADGYSDAKQAVSFQPGKTYASVIEISEMHNNSQGLTIRARPSNTFENFPRGRAVHALKKGFVSGDSEIEFEAGTNWAGVVDGMGVFDISDTANLKCHVVIVAGQSNAIGFGTEGIDLTKDRWHPRIWNLPGATYLNWSADADKLDLANEPLQHILVANNQIGPGMPAARRIAAEDQNARVVLVPCARAATALVGADAPWNPATTHANPDLHLFDTLIERVNSAIAKIGGVSERLSVSLLWSQGEADGADPAYATAFDGLRTAIMTSLGLSELPTVILGPTIPSLTSVPALNTLQAGLDQDSGQPSAIPDVVYFDGPRGPDWVNAGDTVHFNTEAQRIRGDYAGQLLAQRLATGLWPARSTEQ